MTYIAQPDPDLFAKIEAAAHDGAFGTNPRPIPTEGQQKAGNYKKGRVTFYGLPLVIEQPRGSYRTGIDPSGKRWTSRMAAHYGYIAGTKGADGDEVDCFIGSFPHADRAYIINQHVDGKFDEHKVMLGYMSEDEARRAYLGSYDRGWPGLKSMVPLSLSQLGWWLKFGNQANPVSPESLPHEGLEDMEMKRISWDDAATGGPRPQGTTLEKLLYEIRRSDGGADLILDAVTPADIIEDSDGPLTFDALVTPFSRLERKMEILRSVMERTGKNVKPAAMQITDPFKQMGRVMVAVIFELSDGQTVSIYFHNPDTTPAKLAPADELVSWKWLLNKKDITIVAAPERGEDLNVREVARRVMALAEKNSQAFTRANATRVQRMQDIQGLKDEIAGLEKELATAQHELEVALQEKQDRDDAAAKAEAERNSRNWISGDGLRNLADSRGIVVEDVDSEDDVLQATVSKAGMRASLESMSARSWKITEIGENYGSGFEVSAAVLSDALDSFSAAAEKAQADRVAAEQAAAAEAQRQADEEAAKQAEAETAGRQMADELTYARQGTYTAEHLRSIREDSLKAYFAKNPESQAAHEDALTAAEQEWRAAEAEAARLAEEAVRTAQNQSLPAPQTEDPAVVIPVEVSPAESTEKAADRALFQSVVDGTAPNMLDADLADQLEAAYYRHESDAEMTALFEKAVDAYQAAMMAATATL